MKGLPSILKEKLNLCLKHEFIFNIFLLVDHLHPIKICLILLTGCIEDTGLIARVVYPLFTVHGGVCKSSDFIPGGIPVVDISYIWLVD